MQWSRYQPNLGLLQEVVSHLPLRHQTWDLYQCDCSKRCPAGQVGLSGVGCSTINRIACTQVAYLISKGGH